METWDTIRARRNVRQYTDQPIARENLERILEAGRRAPSSGNWQPWNFVVVTDREQRIELAKGLGPRREAHRPVGGDDRFGGQGAGGRAAPRLADVRLGPGDREHDAGSGRPRHRLWPLGGHRPRAGAAGPGIPRRLPRRLPDRPGLPGRPAATAAHQAQPPAFRRGRALEPLVAHAYAPAS